MRYNRNRNSSTPRTIVAKFAGPCGCCGGMIEAGRMVEYVPGKGIWHLKATSGDSPECYSMLKRRNDAGFVDIDRMYEDQCAEICGR